MDNFTDASEPVKDITHKHADLQDQIDILRVDFKNLKTNTANAVKKLAEFDSKIAHMENVETVRLKLNELIGALFPDAKTEPTLAPEVERQRILAALGNPTVQKDNKKVAALSARLAELSK